MSQKSDKSRRSGDQGIVWELWALSTEQPDDRHGSDVSV